MLALMQEAVPYGYLLIAGRSPTSTQLAALAGAPSEQIPDLIAELEAAGVFSRTREGVVYSRRMVRDERKAKQARKNGLRGGNPILCNNEGNSASDNPVDKRGDNTQSPEARGREEENKCAAEVIRLDAPPAKADLAEAWDQFRRTYPRREGSQDWARAKDGFAKAVKAGATVDAIIGGAKRYLAECRRLGIEGTRFVKQARSWLNGRLWEEYGGASPPGSTASISPDWRALVMSFQRSGNWPSSLGPGPGFSGCRVPPPLLAEFGFGALDGVGGGK
ncbi:hypothetical protein ABLE93_15730 [Xanthobacter sp. KR7-65]